VLGLTDWMNGTIGEVENTVHEQQTFDIIVKGSDNKGMKRRLDIVA
jgi:hypothetical protein